MNFEQGNEQSLVILTYMQVTVRVFELRTIGKTNRSIES